MSRDGESAVVAGLALAALPKEGRSAQLRDRLLASVVAPGWRAWRGRVAALWDLEERAVEAIFQQAERPLAWSDTPFEGVDAFHLEGGPRTAGADVGLVRVLAGVHFPSHSHAESEEYVVLEGAMRFEDGRRECAGDRLYNDASVTHGYVAEGDVVLAVVVRGALTPAG
jgi:mannose-6-phosphate isomerase-like protein (cupin superfamily)